MSTGHGQSSLDTFDDKASAAINSFSASIPKTDKTVCFSAKRFFPKLVSEPKNTFENIA